MEQRQTKAPDFESITEWINTQALQPSDVAGSVLGILFFTHSCGNCERAVPKLQQLYEKYRQDGFLLIGIHSPELPTDKDVAAIRAYVKEKKLTFPIGIDNDMMTWHTYGQKYWPTLYLVNREGTIVSRHIGEGGYHRIEKEIKHLLTS